MFRQPTAEKSRGVIRMFGLGVVLLLSGTVAAAQSVQTIDSEAQLAAMLCRNPDQETTNSLLTKNPQLVNSVLWNSLVDCASYAQRHGSAARTLEIYKLSLHIADRLNKPDLLA